jgi:hypothetical protein
MDWEEELKQALKRKEPSADFAVRVVRAAAEGRGVLEIRQPVRVLPRWLPVAAAVLVIAGGGAAYREHQGRVAKEQVMTAMRITAGKLNRIQAHVREAKP